MEILTYDANSITFQDVRKQIHEIQELNKDRQIRMIEVKWSEDYQHCNIFRRLLISIGIMAFVSSLNKTE